MKKFKVTKKVMALALCGIMLVMNMIPANAAKITYVYEDTRYIVNEDTGVEYAEVYIYRDDYSFLIEMETDKMYAGRNKYTMSCNATVTTQDVRKGDIDYYNYTRTVFLGQTSNLFIKDTFTDFVVKQVYFKAIANGLPIEDTY